MQGGRGVGRGRGPPLTVPRYNRHNVGGGTQAERSRGGPAPKRRTHPRPLLLPARNNNNNNNNSFSGRRPSSLSRRRGRCWQLGVMLLADERDATHRRAGICMMDAAAATLHGLSGRPNSCPGFSAPRPAMMGASGRAWAAVMATTRRRLRLGYRPIATRPAPTNPASRHPDALRAPLLFCLLYSTPLARG